MILLKKDIILLDFSSFVFKDKQQCNPGLAAIEAYLADNDINCAICNAEHYKDVMSEADVFGMSVLDSTYAIAAKITEKLKDKTIIWGGWAPTALPEWSLENNHNLDYVILKEGEKRLLDLLNSFTTPGLFDKIDGIAYRDRNKTIKICPPTKYIDINQSPFPGKLATLDNIAFIELSRGCYGNCDYCQEDSKMRFKKAARAVDEIQHWIDNGVDKFYIGNANSIANTQQLENLLEEIEQRKLHIGLCLVGRPDDIFKSRNVLERYFKSDCINIDFVEVGIEADSQRILNLLGRTTTPEINHKAMDVLIGLRDKYSPSTQICANMILFSHPDISLDELIDNIKFIGKYNCSRNTLSPILYGIAGTPVWNDMIEKGFRPEKNLALEIRDYPFSDQVIDNLVRNLVRIPLQKNFLSGNKLSYIYREIQYNCNDIMIDFYNSPDIEKAIADFTKLKTS